MHRTLSFTLALLAMVSTAAVGAVTKTVVDLPSSGGTMRFLQVRPDAPIATVVVQSGGDGIMGIQNNGEITSFVGACNTIGRNADAFAARGIAVVLVNERYPNVLPIVDWLRARDALPIWSAGGSAGAPAAGTLAVQAQAAAPVGTVLFSPAEVPSAPLITGPALVLYHANDPVTGATLGQSVFTSLTSASVREFAVFSGGGSGPCGIHLLSDLDAEFTDVVADFIEKYNPVLPGVASTPVVEYFHAGFGHYFTTADPGEIAGLDAGAYGGAFVRTGRGYKALTAPTGDSVPVCRFFTVTFAPKSSHFYTGNVGECDYVKAFNHDWEYEKIAYHIAVPAAGVCPAGTIPVYRMYNHGQTGAPNHRFTTDFALYQLFTTAQGWDAEGIAFCSPP